MGSQRRLLSLRAYARHRAERDLLGQTLHAVQKAIASGRISTIDGKIDPEVADLQWADRTDPDQAGRAAGQKTARDLPPPPPEGARGDLEDASWRQRKERAEARLAELALQEREGRLVGVAEVQAQARKHAAAIVQQFENIVARYPAEFGADEAMRSKIRQRVREDIDRLRATVVKVEEEEVH